MMLHEWGLNSHLQHSRKLLPPLLMVLSKENCVIPPSWAPDMKCN